MLKCMPKKTTPNRSYHMTRWLTRDRWLPSRFKLIRNLPKELNNSWGVSRSIWVLSWDREFEKITLSTRIWRMLEWYQRIKWNQLSWNLESNSKNRRTPSIYSNNTLKILRRGIRRISRRWEINSLRRKMSNIRYRRRRRAKSRKWKGWMKIRWIIISSS